MGGFFGVAWAVAGRQVYKYFTNPAFLAPALFPLFFFVAFAGGLDAGGRHTRLRLRGWVHRVSVRMGFASGGHDGRGVYGLFDRGGL